MVNLFGALYMHIAHASEIGLVFSHQIPGQCDNETCAQRLAPP